MRRAHLLATLALFAGCRAKHEASSGKEWLEKFQSAAQARDADTCWKMVSKDTQRLFVESVRQIREITKQGGEGAEMLRRDFGLEKRIDDYSDVELAQRMLMRKEQTLKSAFVEEKSEGKLVFLTIDRAGTRETMALVEEDGCLRYDMKATLEKNAR
jgi:hypothetical protein